MARLSLAMGLVSNPKVLFADEPTRELDPAGRQQVWDVLRARRNASAAVVNEGYVYTNSVELKPGESHTIVFAVVVDWSVFEPAQRVINSTGVGFLGDNVNYTQTVSVGMWYRIYFMLVSNGQPTVR